MKYRIIIEQDEDGMFVAEVPSLPGCISLRKNTCRGFKKYSRGICKTLTYKKVRLIKLLDLLHAKIVKLRYTKSPAHIQLHEGMRIQKPESFKTFTRVYIPDYQEALRQG